MSEYRLFTYDELQEKLLQRDIEVEKLKAEIERLKSIISVEEVGESGLVIHLREESQRYQTALEEAVEALDSTKVLTQGPSFETEAGVMVKVLTALRHAKEALLPREGK